MCRKLLDFFLGRTNRCAERKNLFRAENEKRFAPSVNINAREDSMQYVSRYINHKHGIKTARGICPARGRFLVRHTRRIRRGKVQV